MPNDMSLLAQVSVASPCSMNWQDMTGTDQVRYCGHCQSNVYNLSAMTKQDAEVLVLQAEEKRCIRFYRRDDGTILTQNCPKGVQARGRHWFKVASVLLAGLVSGWFGLGGAAYAESPRTLSTEQHWGPSLPGDHAFMGEMVVPEQPPYQKQPAPVPVKPVDPSTQPIIVTPQKPAPPVVGPHKSEGIQPFVRFLACQNPDDSTEPKVTTMALGEEGGHGHSRHEEKMTTMAVGEEGGQDNIAPPSITETPGEEGKKPSSNEPFTTMALGEEGGVSP